MRLEEAITAYRGALKERTRERVPLQWAMTQMNLGNALCKLGNALCKLGERETGTARLEEAITAYDAALKVFVPARAIYTDACRNNRDRAQALLSFRKTR
jgi:tetratricopeptide (TPR) repeat protein